MPYTRGSVAKHNAAAASSGKSATWTKIANNALRSCKASGKGDCDAYSIRVANAMVKRMKESSDFLLEAGRVLSAKNEGRLKAAIKEINDILAMVAPDLEVGDLAQEALEVELVAYLEANPDVVVEVSDLLGEPLQLDEADYETDEVPTKAEVNFRDASEADMDDGHQCNTCGYWDDGQCGLLEVATDAEDLCDSWMDEEDEDYAQEAATQVAGLIASGTVDPAELQALDGGNLEEHNVVPHGPAHGGVSGGGTHTRGGANAAAGQQLPKNMGAASPYNKAKAKAKAARAAGGAGEEMMAARGAMSKHGGVKFSNESEARTAITHLRPGDRAQVKSQGMTFTGTIERTQTGGRTFAMMTRNNSTTFAAKDITSIQLNPPKQGRGRMGRDPHPAIYDSDRSVPLGDVLIENALPMGLEELLEGLRKDGTFPVKIISPGWGTSGYYAPAVLERAASAGRFPAGLRMFWDHPTKSEANERPERSLRDLAAVTTTAGKYRDAGPDGPGVYAEAKAFEQFKPYIEELAPHIGVSMRGYGGTKTGEAEGKKGALVEDIIAVQSADFVTQAGRGGKVLQLFEAARTGEPFTPGDLEESNMPPELVELQETLSASNVTISRLQEQLAYRDARDAAKDLIGASGLPSVTQKRLIEHVLASDIPLVEDARTFDGDKFKEGVDKAIEAEREYLKALGGPVVKDLGESAPPTLEESGKELESALAGIMDSPDLAKLAAAGREN